MSDAKTQKPYQDLLIIISLFFISLIIRGTEISNVGMYPDECVYWRYTNLILANNWTPTKEVLMFQAPLLSYLSAILTILFEGRLEILRMISVVSGSLTVCFIYLLGKRLYDWRVGLLSAFFLCFCAFHILYSQILYLDNLTIFFIVAFSYFFWVGCFEGKGILYVLMAGIMLGLAFDTKYIALFLFIAIFMFVVWVRRSLTRAAIKRIIIALVVAFIVMLPLLIGLYITGVGMHPFHFNAIERFVHPPGGTLDEPIRQLAAEEIVMRGFERYLDVLTFYWVHGQKTIPWHHVFRLSVLIFIPITFLFQIPYFIKAREKESFLVILILSFGLFLLVGCARHNYYLLYTVPFYFIMLSNFTIKLIDQLKNMFYRKTKNIANILRIFLVLIVGVMVLSYFITGIVSPRDRGEIEGLYVAMEHIKNDIDREGNEDVIIGSTLWADLLKHYKYLNHNKLNMSSIFILKLSGYTKLELDINCIKTFKPDYIIVSETEYNSYFNLNAKKEMFDDYRPFFTTHNTPYQFFVFKRFNKDERCLNKGCDERKISGKISPDLFSNTLPGVMTVGKGYTTLVKIRNTGKQSSNYTITIFADNRYLFIDEVKKSVSVSAGSIRTLEFKLVPLRECTHEIEVTVKLFDVEYRDKSIHRICELDSVSDSVYRIKKLI